LRASVNYVGRTSMEIGVRVDSENPVTGEMFHTASAYLTFVGLDEDNKPSQIPALIVETPTEKRRYKHAELRRKARLALKESTNAST
jgi:acyl-CoA hydrolase